MGKKDIPDHRLESVSLSEKQKEPAEIYFAANFESQHHLTRRDFLSHSAALAGVVALASLLLQGCSTLQKIKVPQKVRVKQGTALLDEPGGKPVRITEKEEILDFLEEKGDFVKVKGRDDKQPLWVARMEAVYEQFIEKSLPCGSAIPAGYICTCNCVPVSTPRTTGRTYCSCNKVCTCNLIPVS